jgi:hypothetical protein
MWKMGQTVSAAVAAARPPADYSPDDHPAPRRGIRISRSRSDPQPGAGLDALVLEVVMGWEWRQVEPPDGPPLRLLWNPKWGTPRGGGDVRPIDDARADSCGEGAPAAPADGPAAGPARALPWDAPRPSTDPAAAYELEAEVERRGLQYPYTVALTAIVAHTKSSQQGWENGWRLMRATPAQRCHAALRAAGYGPRC